MLTSLLGDFSTSLLGSIRGRAFIRAVIIGGIVAFAAFMGLSSIFPIEELVPIGTLVSTGESIYRRYNTDNFYPVMIASAVILVLVIGLIMYFDMKRIRKKFAVTEDRRRLLLFGNPLFEQNGESHRNFKVLNSTRGKARAILRDWWGIADKPDVIDTCERLSTAQNHTGFADDVFNNLIKKGVLKPTLEDLQVLSEENAQQFDRVKNGISTFNYAKKHMQKLGYTEEELMEIDTLAAWDYGRTAFIARYSAHAKYITEDEAWPHIEAAADNASAAYGSWRQYLAAYVIGRSVAYGEYLNIGAKALSEDGLYNSVEFKKG